MLNLYINRETKPTLSVTRCVLAEDEWCAEAYMETNYSSLNKNDFIKTIKAYIAFQFLNSKNQTVEISSKKFSDQKNIELEIQKWKVFNYEDIFDMKAGKFYPNQSYQDGYTPLVSASENNNGVVKFTDLEPKYANSLTVGKIGMSTYYQNIPFIATSDVTVLMPKREILFNKYIGLFIATVMNQEKYKWSYGRQIRLNDCKKLTSKLPATTQGKPDWEFMENYIKSLPYSISL